MTKIIMKFAPSDVMRGFFFKEGRAIVENVVKPNLSRYEVAAPIETHHTGQDAAEEAFDLTNNPGRQDEREEKYGNGRSLSSGDVVEVIDGDHSTSYVCMSFGWEIL